MNKKELRSFIKAEFKNCTQNLTALSEHINQKLLESEQYKEASVILGYMSLPDEADLSVLLQKAVEDGKKVFIPRIIPDTNLMDFYDYSAEVEKGSFGISEPEALEELKFIPETAGGQKILMLVPGRAFDKQGNRLGRGKGFYDVYIQKLKNSCPKLCLAGVGFGFQLVETVPAESHDISMDFVITENQLYADSKLTS